jgi:RNA polymerase sigma-70 factor (ECF subfamily)
VADLDLGKLYDRHGQGLFTCALAITRDRAMAEDAVHVAFERICRRMPTNVSDAPAYVYRAVRMAAIEQLRRSARRSEVDDEAARSIVDPTALPEGRVLERERAAGVAAALDDLPAPQRETIVLRLYGGLTFAQIADVVNEPLATVAARYRRGLEQLRLRLEKLV